ncbi:hypothetical protein QJU89_02825 [Pasteurella skyensis]|uniref:Uncharacterized protein n=1 Tax=Phocoenobacter skyensis TaxID=97481 RepID=A0AAJ6N8W3_9PAST|nr:hypothetical protein [Pasteurella skyensis]MDP8162293.1 hypothetical protein [Pasteurella skyensis]MDP8172373.1 hypothetical protein [Pasteurella skyensis]MDP8176954.1 hypothetical protein [Pasteurella skyensis]MDP8178628.1 hypothetical protein [Pasteurella skyensis]MDP8182630.1 hypothetical protein [Pasteurella skyensis]
MTTILYFLYLLNQAGILALISIIYLCYFILKCYLNSFFWTTQKQKPVLLFLKLFIPFGLIILFICTVILLNKMNEEFAKEHKAYLERTNPIITEPIVTNGILIPSGTKLTSFYGTEIGFGSATFDKPFMYRGLTISYIAYICEDNATIKFWDNTTVGKFYVKPNIKTRIFFDKKDNIIGFDNLISAKDFTYNNIKWEKGTKIYYMIGIYRKLELEGNATFTINEKEYKKRLYYSVYVDKNGNKTALYKNKDNEVFFKINNFKGDHYFK